MLISTRYLIRTDIFEVKCPTICRITDLYRLKELSTSTDAIGENFIFTMSRGVELSL